MEHLFQLQFPDYTDFSMLSIAQPTSAEPEDYCEEIMRDGKKYHSCTFPNCGKTFRFKSEFSRHKLTHTPQRPLDCSYMGCTKTFKREDALKNHMRIHTGEMPFKCEEPECGQSFPTKSGLRYHKLKHTGQKECRCSFPGCGKTFLTMSQLKQHESALNYHQKVSTQIAVKETESTLDSHQKVSTQIPISEPEYKVEIVKTEKGKDLFFGEFFEPEVKQLDKLEWGTQNQNDFECVSTGADEDLQMNFEKMVKKIFTENTAMKKRLDMCNTLMGLMQENNDLKSKLNRVSEFEQQQVESSAPLSTQDFSDEKIFSFLNFDNQNRTTAFY